VARFIAAGYHDTFRVFVAEPGHYTWWDLKTGARARNVGWRIDYFFVSDELRHRVAGASILPAVLGSDHCRSRSSWPSGTPSRRPGRRI
jgi:exodeoxyribonuclease-3